MPAEHDRFRDFGLAPINLAPPDGPVRAYFPWYHVCAQFAGSGCFSAIALLIACAFAFGIPFPYGLPLVPLPILGIGAMIYFVTRHDSAWIELDGGTLRARHLYTRRVVTRRVEEVKELFTHVLGGVNLTATLVNAWLGRVRAVEVRFNDGTTPMKICRTDPAMKGAQELIEAILYRMTQIGEVDYDVVIADGKPLVKRVYWKNRDFSRRSAPPVSPGGLFYGEQP